MFKLSNTPLKLRPGPLHSRNDAGMSLVFSDSTRRAAQAHIGQTSQRVADFFLWHLEVGNFDQKMTLFFGNNVYYLATYIYISHVNNMPKR